MKRQHDHSNSYTHTRMCIHAHTHTHTHIYGLVNCSKVWSIYSTIMWETRQHWGTESAGRHGAAEGDIQIHRQGQGVALVLAWASKPSKPTPQGQSFSNNITPIPTRPHLLEVPFPMAQGFKHFNLWGLFYFKQPQLLNVNDNVLVYGV